VRVQTGLRRRMRTLTVVCLVFRRPAT